MSSDGLAINAEAARSSLNLSTLIYDIDKMLLLYYDGLPQTENQLSMTTTTFICSLSMN